MDTNTPVKEIMTKDVISLHPEESLYNVEKTFEKKAFHHIPIVDVNQAVVGMVSKTDLLQLSAIKENFSEKEFKYLKISDFMTRNLTVVSPDDSVQDVANIFKSNRFHALPVVKGEKLQGIVTTHDLINFVFS